MDVGDLMVEDVKRQGERYVVQTGRRVVVVIDDIDRTASTMQIMPLGSFNRQKPVE